MARELCADGRADAAVEAAFLALWRAPEVPAREVRRFLLGTLYRDGDCEPAPDGASAAEQALTLATRAGLDVHDVARITREPASVVKRRLRAALVVRAGLAR